VTAVPTNAPNAATDVITPRCEFIWQCPDKCTPPERCERRATVRVTFGCASTICTKALHLMLLCRRCAEQADRIGKVLARRPL
jgi:hypothetical protein